MLRNLHYRIASLRAFSYKVFCDNSEGFANLFVHVPVLEVDEEIKPLCLVSSLHLAEARLNPGVFRAVPHVEDELYMQFVRRIYYFLRLVRWELIKEKGKWLASHLL